MVRQPARNVAMGLGDRGMPIRFLLGDHDAKFTRSFDDLLDLGLCTPIRAPKANPDAGPHEVTG
jgi:hypothetical protein